MTLPFLDWYWPFQYYTTDVMAGSSHYPLTTGHSC